MPRLFHCRELSLQLGLFDLPHTKMPRTGFLMTEIICFSACHESCKSTCWEGGPKGCDECKSGWTASEEEGCIGMCNFPTLQVFISLTDYQVSLSLMLSISTKCFSFERKKDSAHS